MIAYPVNAPHSFIPQLMRIWALPTFFALVNDAVMSIAVPLLAWTCASLLLGRHLGGELLGPWKLAV